MAKEKLPKMCDIEMFAMLATNGMLIKRPILIAGNRLLVGFKEDEWEQIK